MRTLYLVAAVLGAIIPYLFFIEFILIEGLNISLFITSLFVNAAAGGFTADLLISSFVFWFFMFNQFNHNTGPTPYLFIALNLTIGLSCALPAYLYAQAKLNDGKE